MLTDEWYCKSLIRRGFRDALAQGTELAQFLDVPLLERRRPPRPARSPARLRESVAPAASAPAVVATPAYASALAQANASYALPGVAVRA
jgi:hypothetical protein